MAANAWNPSSFCFSIFVLLIVSDSGQFLSGRRCPGGNPAIPEVSLQSVE
jgi:hypothetical protein